MNEHVCVKKSERALESESVSVCVTERTGDPDSVSNTDIYLENPY